MAFFKDITNAVSSTANAVANTAQEAARAAQRAAEKAAREAQRVAEDAARQAQQAAEKAAQEAQEQLQNIGKVTVQMSQEAVDLADDIGNEIARFGGDAVKAAKEGALKPIADRLIQQLESENPDLFRQVRQIQNNLSDKSGIASELRQLSVKAMSGDIDPEIAKQQILKLSQRIGLDRLSL